MGSINLDLANLDLTIGIKAGSFENKPLSMHATAQIRIIDCQITLILKT